MDNGQASQDQSRKQEAYLLFPAHMDGTLLDSMKAMQAKQEFFSTLEVLQIFHQVNKNQYVLHKSIFSFSEGKCKGQVHMELWSQKMMY